MAHPWYRDDSERPRGDGITRVATHGSRKRHLIAGLVAAMLWLPVSMKAAPAATLYELTIETGMPHLDENLRYATRRERACLDASDLSREFTVLHDVSLRDCRLVDAPPHDGAIVYELQCSGGHGTTGRATWQLDDRSIAGTLDVKLGGKNMTFYQRITGRAIGRCEGR